MPEILSSISFGPFEVDLRTQELRKGGIRLHLPGQSFQVLRMLLTRPGELVTREELRRELWPSDTFVDFEHGLNAAVNKLRQVLGDDADDPRYVETLPRRGYRFIGSVTPLKSAKADPIGVSREEEPRTRSEGAKHLAANLRHLNDQETAETPALQANSGVTRPRTFAPAWWMWATTLVIAVSLLLGLFWWHRPLPQPRIVATRQLTHDSAHKRSLMTDGNRIYFVEEFWQTARLAQVSVAGGEVSLINTGSSLPDLGDISPDGSELLGTINIGKAFQEQICVFPVLTGVPRRIGDLIGHDPGWAPDGKLLFAKGNDIWVAEHDGSSPRKLLTTSGVPWYPQFSPDGIHFSFTLWNPTTSTTKLWTARLDGTGFHEMLTEWGQPPAECCGRWTPDGKYFIFAARQNNASSLWALPQKTQFGRVLSGAPIQLITGPLRLNGILPAKNGKQIFMVGTQPKGELVQVDTKTGRFTPILGGIFASDVDYSRDDLWITYVLYPDQTLWRSRVDGSERVQLTFPPMQAILPHWSPDGLRIAFVASMPGNAWHIFVIDKDGGVPQAISSSEESQTEPSWSKDGQTIAFSHDAVMDLEGDKSYIGMFDVKSREITRLAGSDGIQAPRWSPDGRYIAALAEDNRVLTLYDLQSRKWKTMLRRQEPFGFITWSHDATAIYFDTLLTDQPTIWRLRVRDAKLDPIVNLSSYRLYPESNPFKLGSWNGLAPGDVPLLVRDISTSEIYALDVDFP